VEKDLALIEQFLDALWLEKNLAENTLSAYRRDLTMLVEWLAQGLSRARKATTCRRCWRTYGRGLQSHQLRALAQRHASAVPASLP
jgi:site-specific recombinase XerD